MINRLTQAECEAALNKLNAGGAADQAWQISDNKLEKTFLFGDFIQAFAWMTKISIWAEKLDHHPEWFNVYNRVSVQLTTHDAGGITGLDFQLAEKMQQLS